MSERPTPKGSMLYEARSQVKVLQKLLNDAERERDEALEEREGCHRYISALENLMDCEGLKLAREIVLEQAQADSAKEET